MRALLAALVALAALPATASAQVVLQDLSLTGQVVATHSATEKTVRFTATNHGPGPLAGHAYISLQVSIDESIVAAPGCTLQKVMPLGYAIGGRCELGSGLAAGATRSVDARVRLLGINYDQDYVIGTVHAATAPGGMPLGDANGVNDQARVDLGIVPPPPAMQVAVTVPGWVMHGNPVSHIYTIANTGGYDLTDVVVSDDRCPSAQMSGNPVVRRAGGVLTFACTWTAPAHRKGDDRFPTHVTVTARAGDRTLTHTATRSTYFLHPSRACGTFRVRRRGKVTRWKATTTMPDVPCKRVRKQLAACRSRHRAPSGFRCRTFKSMILVRPKSLHANDLMRATKI